MQFDFFTNSGGIPIVVDGQMIGAIGVGGGAAAAATRTAPSKGSRRRFGDRVTLPVYPAVTAQTGAAR